MIMAGSLTHKCYQAAAAVAIRTPFLKAVFRPAYRYALRPGQLSWLCEAITQTAGRGCIVEVGVARGKTTRHLIEHMKDIGDTRPYFCIDTFNGFVGNQVDVEVRQRGKVRGQFIGYRYNSASYFEKSFSDAPNVKAVAVDAATFDWASLPGIAVLLADVDLYVPTISILEGSEPRLVSDAWVMVDDVRDGGCYDGAYQAYIEYCEKRGIVPQVVGGKGGVIRRP